MSTGKLFKFKFWEKNVIWQKVIFFPKAKHTFELEMRNNKINIKILCYKCYAKIMLIF